MAVLIFYLNSCQVSHRPPFLGEGFSFFQNQEEEMKYELKENLSYQCSQYTSSQVTDISKGLARFDYECFFLLKLAKISYEDLLNQFISQTNDLELHKMIKISFINLRSTFFDIQRDLENSQKSFYEEKVWQEIQLQQIGFMLNDKNLSKEWQFYHDQYRKKFLSYIDTNKKFIETGIERFSKVFLQALIEFKPFLP